MLVYLSCLWPFYTIIIYVIMRWHSDAVVALFDRLNDHPSGMCNRQQLNYTAQQRGSSITSSHSVIFYRSLYTFPSFNHNWLYILSSPAAYIVLKHYIKSSFTSYDAPGKYMHLEDSNGFSIKNYLRHSDIRVRVINLQFIMIPWWIESFISWDSSLKMSDIRSYMWLFYLSTSKHEFF